MRSELRRLGYLDHRFERFLLQDALRSRQTAGTLLLLTAKVGLLSGLALALVLALALGAANGNLSASPLDLAPLFLHLFLPISLAAGLAFLALCAVILLVIRLYHVRRIEALSLAMSLVAGVGVLALALRLGGEVLAEGRLAALAGLALITPPLVYLMVKLVYNGLLTLAIRFTDAAPVGRLFSGRWLGFAILAGAALLALPALVAALTARRAGPAAAPVALPTGPGERVVLLGIDGVLPEEVDYLLALGELPEMGRLAGTGRLLAYRRKPEEPPASFWTAVATGIPGPDHGVTSLDSFRPLGMRTPLARSGPLRAWWSRVEVPLGLAEYRPVLANRRRAFTVWELASRGGEPSLAVNWWATFPAEALPAGLVVAHGAYQLLGERGEGALAPEAARGEMAALAAAMARGAADPRLTAALPGPAAGSVADRALRPDRFYREVFARRMAEGAVEPPRAAALYLPGADIAADGWRGGDVALADLVRGELAAADRLLAGSLAGVGTVAVVLDPGRRRAGGGAGASSGGARPAAYRPREQRRGAWTGSSRRRSPPPSCAPSGCRRARSSRRPLPNAAGRRRRSWWPATASRAGARRPVPRGRST